MNVKLAGFLRQVDAHRAMCSGELRLILNHVFPPDYVTVAMGCATCGAMIRARFTAAELGGADNEDEVKRALAVLNALTTVN